VLFNFCKNIKKILKGVDKYFNESVSTNFLAFNFYLKHKGNKNKNNMTNSWTRYNLKFWAPNCPFLFYLILYFFSSKYTN